MTERAVHLPSDLDALVIQIEQAEALAAQLRAQLRSMVDAGTGSGVVPSARVLACLRRPYQERHLSSRPLPAIE